MRLLICILLIVLLRCLGSPSTILEDDFDQRHLIGSWIRITERPSGIGGLYYKDTTCYRIGIDQSIIPDTVLPYAEALSFVVQYPLGGSDYSFLRDPQGQDYDEDGCPIIVYSLEDVLSHAMGTVVIYRPAADSILLDFGTEYFGLKRWR